MDVGRAGVWVYVGVFGGAHALEAVDGEDDDAEQHGEEEEPDAEALELQLQRRLGRGALPVGVGG